MKRGNWSTYVPDAERMRFRPRFPAREFVRCAACFSEASSPRHKKSLSRFREGEAAAKLRVFNVRLFNGRLICKHGRREDHIRQIKKTVHDEYFNHSKAGVVPKDMRNMLQIYSVNTERQIFRNPFCGRVFALNIAVYIKCLLVVFVKHLHANQCTSTAFGRFYGTGTAVARGR